MVTLDVCSLNKYEILASNFFVRLIFLRLLVAVNGSCNYFKLCS